MRYNTIAKTAPLALPAELQAHFYELLWVNRVAPA